jgi:hypothetical protein
MNPYRTEQVRHAYVDIVGRLWMGQRACYRYKFSDRDLKEIGEFTRDKVKDWLGKHAGDFSRVDDFSAVCGDEEIAWEKEESEQFYSDCFIP